MTAQYPGDIEPRPDLVYSVERLCSEVVGSTFAPIVLRDPSNGSTYSYPYTDDHIPAGYLTALAGKSFLECVVVRNQIQSDVGRLLQHIGGTGQKAPRMRDSIKIGPSPCILFNGGTDVGNIYSLDIQSPLSSLGIKADNLTVIAVIRPSTSRFCNQSAAPNFGDGTILSLDGKPVIGAVGTTTAGSPVITGVSPAAGIEFGMRVDGPPFTRGALIASVAASGPNTCTVTTADFAAEQSGTFQLRFSQPLMSFYQAGDASPGSFAMTDHRITSASLQIAPVTLQPQEFSGVEINPVVVSWIAQVGVGMRVYMNEIVRSGLQVSTRTETVDAGYVGQLAGSQFGGFSRGGEFELAALMIWNQALTQAQRAIVCGSLYQRFGIKETVSTRKTKSITILGDSIAADYVAFGNYGWSKRLAEKFSNNVRICQYAVPGSQVTTAIGMPPGISTDQLFPLSVAGHMDYGKQGKNVLILWSAGNDVVSNIPDMKYSIDVVSNQVSIFFDGATSLATAAGGTVLTFGAQLGTAFIYNAAAGAIVENLTTPASIPGGTTVTSSDFNHVTLSAPVAAPGVGNGDIIRLRWHNMVADDRIWFAQLPVDPITLAPTVTGISINTTYYVKTLASPFKFTIAATPGGAAIDIGGTFAGSFGCYLFNKNATDIFGTPTTAGHQKIVADANAAGASRVYILTALPIIGDVYTNELSKLNTLIKAGGAGGYTVIDIAADPAFADHNVPPGHVGAMFADIGHLNDAGSQKVADILFPILDAYLSS